MATHNSTGNDAAAVRGAVLRRKFGAARPPDPAVMTPAKALRLALSRAAEEGLHLAATVLGVKEERLAQAPFLETLEEAGLLLVLQGPDGAQGLAVPDAQLLGAMIEVQTMGRVMAAPAVARPPTPTDAAMCRGFLDLALAKLAQELDERPAGRWVSGYRYDRCVENTRLLGLMLADVPYRVFRISLDLAGGAKQGALTLAFPVVPQAERAPPTSPRARADIWRHAMEDRVLDSETQLHAVLHRLTMPLAQARGLKVGDLLTVPVSAVADVSLETLAGVSVSRVRLGQQNGCKAVRLLGQAPTTNPTTNPATDPARSPQTMAALHGDAPPPAFEMAMAAPAEMAPPPAPISAPPTFDPAAAAADFGAPLAPPDRPPDGLDGRADGGADGGFGGPAPAGEGLAPMPMAPMPMDLDIG